MAKPIVSEPTPSYTAPTKPIPKQVVATATNTIKKRRKSIIRIKPDASEKVDAKEIHYGDTQFTQEDLLSLWKKYAENIKQTSGGFSGSILANCTPTLNEDQKTVHLIFRTSSNEAKFLNMSDELLMYLKSNLKNNYITFETEVNKEKAKKVLYSNRDKFNHFAEQYPKLKDWETKLGLDLN